MRWRVAGTWRDTIAEAKYRSDVEIGIGSAGLDMFTYDYYQISMLVDA